MGLSFLRTFNFRNLVNTAGIYFEGKEIFLIGKNGQGKTNFLEAVYYLCSGVSFRTRLKRDLIREGESEAAIFGSFIDNTGSNFSFGLEDKVKVTIKENSIGVIEKNQERVKSRIDLFFDFPVVVFSHEDMSLVKGPMELRRNFFDRTISLFEREYFESLKAYYRVLKSKNAALKSESAGLLNIYDEKLISYGTFIMERRWELIGRFNEVFSQVLSSIAGELSSLRIVYEPSWKEWKERESIRRKLVNLREREKSLGFSLSGPHRDRFYFEIEGRNFLNVASTGQIRLCALALKSGQARFVFERRKKRPILLLDDVLLEVDGEKKLDFLDTLSGYDQSFFTFLPEEDFLSYKKSSTEIFCVRGGSLSEWRKQEKF